MLLSRRTAIKWVHWLSVGLILYFFLVEPENVRNLGAAALATHAGVGVILAVIASIWTIMTLRKGLAGRPGPKLPNWGKILHRLNHRALSIGLPVMVATGALTGFAAPYVIRAFGVLAINPGFGNRSIHGFLEEVHEIAFNVLLVLIVVHMALHIGRHFLLKDNALRIMSPKILHRYL